MPTLTSMHLFVVATFAVFNDNVLTKCLYMANIEFIRCSGTNEMDNYGPYISMPEFQCQNHCA